MTDLTGNIALITGSARGIGKAIAERYGSRGALIVVNSASPPATDIFESDDAGATWRSPNVGLEVGYLRSVAIDPKQPEIVVVSASSGPYSAYVAGRSDGRLYRHLTRARRPANHRVNAG